MKKKIIGIFICSLLVVCAFTVVGGTNSEKTKLTNEKDCSHSVDVTLITECHYGRVIEVDDNYNIIWEKTGLNEPFDSERLENGNTLIADSGDQKIIEVDSDGNIVWEYSCYGYPCDIERLDNGNTLITYYNGEFIVEVDSEGMVVWYIMIIGAVDAERLDNGNTLIATWFDVREVDYNGDIVWQKTGLNFPEDVERLDNGNTLITEWGGNRIIEINFNGDIVWEFTNLDNLSDAERLENGNTLIADTNGARVIEVDSDGNIIWSYMVGCPWDVERVLSCVGQPPDKPSIIGPTSGKVGEEIEFTFNAVDPDGDDVEYYIDWDDGYFETTDFNPSGEDVKVNHTWYSEGTYNITAYARDEFGLTGPEVTHTITITKKSRAIKTPFLKFLKQYLNLFQILQKIIQRFEL